MGSSYYHYWGKSAGAVHGNGTVSYHLLPYHCLDVAAVGHVLLKVNNVLHDNLARITGLQTTHFTSWVTFFLSLHDIGKFADSFQNLNPYLLNKLQGRKSDQRYGGVRHDSLGAMLWYHSLRDQFLELGIMPRVNGSKRRAQSTQPIDIWMEVMTGHHGQPARPVTNPVFSDYFNEPWDYVAATAFLKAIIPIFLSDPHFPPNDLEKIKSASWWLAGFVVLCDWLGSSTDFFPYKSEPISLEEYWLLTKKHAEEAVNKSGLMPVNLSSRLTLEQVLTSAKDEPVSPTPLQQAVLEFPLIQSPSLVIMEDVTGAGKTEAAILMAHRLMKNSNAEGLYFALPTMATANSMYSRMAMACNHLFAADGLPTLVLAHGARNLSAEFRDSILTQSNGDDDSYGDGTIPAGAHCTAWLADHRKKALLANIGVGTIDQALLSILPSRHQSMRLVGLMNKILIVDEVHACDSYMHELLCSLLNAHASCGGSAILLSATLPIFQRRGFIKAFAQGCTWNPPGLTQTDYASYPLLTVLDKNGVREQVTATRSSVKRRVDVKFINKENDITAILQQAVMKGKCVCWIRNTVADAREAYHEFKQRNPDWKVQLFHARFILKDRLNIERQVIRNFGKDSSAEKRRSRILIATQVVEQSLDLDFDEMISDLAPIDLIIQRAGRLCRHNRDTYGNRINGKDQRSGARLYIFSPEIVEDPDACWFADFFKRAASVYENHGHLYLTARLLHEKGGFSMPEDARELIESVYSGEAQWNIPEGLLGNSLEATGSSRAKASLARLNALDLQAGYSDGVANRWWDESVTPTRLGEETGTVYLARYQDGQLVPFSEEKLYPWQYSSVSIRTFLIKTEAEFTDIPQDHINACKNEMPAKGKWGVLIPVMKINSDFWMGSAKDEAGTTVSVYYHPLYGLMLGKEYQQLRENIS